jgi:hypothetical protein
MACDARAALGVLKGAHWILRTILKNVIYVDDVNGADFLNGWIHRDSATVLGSHTPNMSNYISIADDGQVECFQKSKRKTLIWKLFLHRWRTRLFCPRGFLLFFVWVWTLRRRRRFWSPITPSDKFRIPFNKSCLDLRIRCCASPILCAPFSCALCTFRKRLRFADRGQRLVMDMICACYPD